MSDKLLPGKGSHRMGSQMEFLILQWASHTVWFSMHISDIFQHVPVLSNGFWAFQSLFCCGSTTFLLFIRCRSSCRNIMKLSVSFVLSPLNMPRFCLWASFMAAQSFENSPPHAHGSEKNNPSFFLTSVKQIAEPIVCKGPTFLVHTVIIWRILEEKPFVPWLFH